MSGQPSTAASKVNFKDHFSGHATDYTRYRPGYPPGLFEYLASLSEQRERVWDCGTGNGQAAVGLAGYFDEVIATDASAEQIANAVPHTKIRYAVAPAEATAIPAHTVDLITVAQALHWFDFDAFYAEARRVLRPDGHLAVWSYGLLWVSDEVDPVLRRFYGETIEVYWPPERRHIEAAYRSIPFPFRELTPPAFNMQAHWSLDDLCNYLRTWSAVRRYQSANREDPVLALAAELATVWGRREDEKIIRWPLHLRIGLVGE